jgi:subtilisin family serine protease
MNYLLDFANHLTDQEIQEYMINHGFVALNSYDHFKNIILVSSEIEPVKDDFVIEVVADNSNPLQLLSLDINIIDNAVPGSFNIDDQKNWWKVASLDQIDFDEENVDYFVRGFDSTVYIVDSGIDDSHSEFVGRNITNLYSFTGEFSDTRGHGTAIASLISGVTCGLTGANLKIVKIFDNTRSILQSELLSALDSIASDYVAGGKMPSVVNMSWGIARNDYINAKIQSLCELGLFVVAAAGNSGMPISDITPASIPDVLTVGSYGQSLTPSNFSNYTDPSIISYATSETNNGALDGWAPGEQIWHAGLNGTYGYSAGTSLSAAIASGAVAYNLSFYTGSDVEITADACNYARRRDEILQIIGDDKPYTINSVYSVIAIRRRGLLDLSDAKYTGSYNAIITYAPLITIRPRSIIRTVIENTTVSYILFPKNETSKITSDESLPDWVTIDDRGFITISAPSTDGAAYLYFEPITMDIINRNGSTDTVTFSLVVLREDITKDNIEQHVDADDEVLNIVLYNTGSCVQSTVVPVPTFCTDDCPGQISCSTIAYGKSSNLCQCNF